MGMKPVAKRARSKSKRITLKDKYKIQKKVREHNRKLRRKQRLEGKSTLKKDPGVPAMHPFRKEILQEVQESKDRIQQEKLERRKAAKEAREAKAKMTLADLQRDAEQRSRVFETARDMQESTTQAPVKDQSRRAFFKHFAQVVEEADVILQVLDARDPLASRSDLVEQTVAQAKSRKRLVLVLNKIDLVPREVATQWVTYLRNEFPTIMFKASTQTQRSHLTHSESSQAGCYGADSLIQLLQNYCRNANIKTAITVGVVGYPNVGKSSIINSLKRAKAAVVGALPGVTRTVQRVMLTKNICLLDSPGIVFASQTEVASLALRNCVRSDALDDPITAIEQLLRRCDIPHIMELYNVPKFETTFEFLQLYGKRLGKLKKGGIPDIESAARQVLHDFHVGKISFYTRAPESYKPENMLSAAVVTEWAKEFELEDIYGKNDEAVLPHVRPASSLKKNQRVELQPTERIRDDIGAVRMRGPDEMDDEEEGDEDVDMDGEEGEFDEDDEDEEGMDMEDEHEDEEDEE
eukprot:m.96064 g.96064  ORF g.96064 m.96064 type:complete len:522 (+) comp14780_c1_seq1:106-1671(+)